MKIMILDEEFPYPANTGKRTRSFNLYRRLAGKFQICYLAYGEAGSMGTNALREQGIEPIAVCDRVPPKHGAMFYLRLIANLCSALPYIVTSHHSRMYQLAVRDALTRFQPDVVLCEWLPYVIYAKTLSTVTRLVSAHNIEADIWRRYHETERNAARRWYIRRQWRKVERFERAAVHWVDGALAVSALDRAELRRSRTDLPTRIVPNGVDLDYFSPTPQPHCRRQLVFTGSMDWRPNQQAARYFAGEILPRLRGSRPQLECTFVGRDPPSEIRALERMPGIHVTGTVDDVRPYVERAAVYIVPLQIGGGSRLKILEALAMGRPVVSTGVGAEGLEVRNQQHLILADDPAHFAYEVLRLLDDPVRCAELGNAGRQLVEEKYGWDRSAGELEAFIREMASPRAQRASLEKHPGLQCLG
jgi:sugar transferase (PEP-CTERM/EpsH1 system associated)